MLSDTFPGQPFQTGSQVDVAILLNDVEKSKEVFGKLLEEGEEIGQFKKRHGAHHMDK